MPNTFPGQSGFEPGVDSATRRSLFDLSRRIDASASETALNDLADVNAPAPSNDQVLTWNTATSKWINQSPAAVVIPDPLLLSDGTALAPSYSFTSSSGGTGMFVPGANQLGFATGGTTRLTIANGGKVGIGTTAPRAQLDVSSATGTNPSTPTEIAITTSTDSTWVDGDVWGKLAFRSADTSGGAVAGDIAASISASQASVYGYTTDLNFATRGTPGLSTKMRIDAEGKVGIGTTAPNKALDVVSSGTTELSIRSTDSVGDSALLFGNVDDTYQASIFYDASVQSLKLKGYNNTTRLTIDSVGKVGIGTTSPVNTLSVGDAANIGSFNVHASGGSESFRVSTTVVRSANIAGLTTASAANVHISTANNTMYRSTSSLKYKTAVETLENEYADIVFELRPVWYRSIAGNDPEDHSYYGLIAEEVAEVDPRLVHFGASSDCGCVADEDGHIEHEQSCLTEPEGVFYERIVPHLINLVARQRAELAELKDRLDALEQVQ
jgi:hypothetical protein